MSHAFLQEHIEHITRLPRPAFPSPAAPTTIPAHVVATVLDSLYDGHARTCALYYSRQSVLVAHQAYCKLAREARRARARARRTQRGPTVVLPLPPVSDLKSAFLLSLT